MIHFFCATPLQIFTTVVMGTGVFREDKIKVYILDYFKEADKFVERVKSLNIFDSVELIRSKRMYDRI